MTSSLTSVVLCKFLLTIDDTALEIFLSLIITTVNILPNETSRKRKEKKREATMDNETSRKRKEKKREAIMDNRKVRLTNRVCGSCEILHL
jgi:chromatin remodeling complex protein RSC6